MLDNHKEKNQNENNQNSNRQSETVIGENSQRPQKYFANIENRNKARNEVFLINKKAAESGQNTGTWGNMSVRVMGEAAFAITPSGMDPSEMTPDDIVIMDYDGNVIDGDAKPSSEFRLHIHIYRAREDAFAIVHTHAVHCTALAIARKPIPASCEDLIQIVGGDVRVSEYVLPGTDKLGENVVTALDQRTAVLMANHGLVAIGSTMKEAYKTALICEKSAHATLLAANVGGAVELDEHECSVMRDFYLNHYGQGK